MYIICTYIGRDYSPVGDKGNVKLNVFKFLMYHTPNNQSYVILVANKMCKTLILILIS